MKIKITEKYHQDLLRHKYNLLLIKRVNVLCYIKDFNVEEIYEIKKHWFKPNEHITRKYLTSLDVVIYNSIEKFFGFMSDDSIEQFFIYQNLDKLRQNWEDLKELLDAFGFNKLSLKEN